MIVICMMLGLLGWLVTGTGAFSDAGEMFGVGRGSVPKGVDWFGMVLIFAAILVAANTHGHG